MRRTYVHIKNQRWYSRLRRKIFKGRRKKPRNKQWKKSRLRRQRQSRHIPRSSRPRARRLKTRYC